jgi:hypothetical protein
VPILEGAITRLRKLQFGYQGSNMSAHFATPVAATRVLPWSGVPDVNRNATFPEVDTGTIFKAVLPYYGRADITLPTSGQLTYDDMPVLWNGALKANASPTGGGAAKTWVFQPSATGTHDPMGIFTVEQGDGVGDPAPETPSDWFQLVGGLIEQLSITGDTNGPLNHSATWRFGKANSTGSTSYPVTGTVPTAALSVDGTPSYIELGDCELFIDATAGAIGTTKISDALESIDLQITNTFDQKGPANGSNTKYITQSLGLGEQAATLALQFHKTSQTVGLLSEADKWYAANPTLRFIELRFTRNEMITGSTPYSMRIRMPLVYTTRADGEIDSNTTITLTGTALYNSTLTYGIESTVVCATTSTFA